jgi:hypothetical protein
MLISVVLLILLCGPAIANQDTYLSDRAAHDGSLVDTQIWGDTAPDTRTFNYGGAPGNWIGDWGGGDLRTVWRVDISPVPQSATIITADAWFHGHKPGNNQTVTAYQIATANEDWGEGTSNGAAEVGTACWYDHTYNNTQEWAGGEGCDVAGTDYVNTSLGTFTIDTDDQAETLTFNSTGEALFKSRLLTGDIELIFFGSDHSASAGAYWHASETGSGDTHKPYVHLEWAIVQCM